MRTSVVITASVILLLMTPALFASDGPTRDDLASAAASNAARIATFQIAFSESQEIKSGDLGGRVLGPESYSIIKGEADMKNYRWERFRREDGAEEMTGPTVQVSNGGGNMRVFIEPNLSGLVLTEEGPIRLEENTIFRSALMFPSKPGGYGFDDLNMQSLLAHGCVNGQDVINGYNCSLVEITINDIHAASVWISLDQGGLPIRGIVYGPNQTIASQMDVLGVSKFDDGSGNFVWLPNYIVHTINTPQVSVEVSTLLDEANTHVNPEIAPEVYALDFPEGVVISDYSDSAQEPKFFRVSADKEWVALVVP